MSEKLPTKSELMTELEEDAKIFKKHFFDCEICESKKTGKKALMLFIDDEMYFIGDEFAYRPEPVAPAKWEPVFVKALDHTGKHFASAMVSAGYMNESGSLMVFAHEKISGFDDWCSVNNRNHHSDGWNREWEPDND